VRTFLNPLAGMLEMRARRFFVWNVVGAILWTESIIIVGHYLGSKVDGVDKYVLPVVALAVLASVVPVLREVLRGRREPSGTRDATPDETLDERPDARAGRPAGQEERL
jgi:membrane-associated protein